MVRIAPRVTNEAFWRADLLARNIGFQPEKRLFESGTLIGCTPVRFYLLRLFLRELNRLVGLGQRNLVSASVAECEFSTAGHLLADDGAIEPMAYRANHRFKAPHCQVPTS